VTVDGTDPLKVYAAVGKAADRARSGKGPSLLEAKFYRLSAHGNAITVPPVPTQFPEHEAVEVYGKKAEYAAARKNDPIPRFRAALIRKGTIRIADAKSIEAEARAEMEDAVQFALASPPPAGEEAVKYVYA
jgi:TPP-dependent pyruvate/acetoin dehydrogenase alpha subunit